MSTEAFHRQFADKEACYLAVLDQLVAEARTWVADSLAASDSWPQAVRRALGAFTEHLLANPALRQVAFVHVFEVGPAMVAEMTRSIEGLTGALAEQGPVARHGGAVTRDAVTGALWAIVASSAGSVRCSRLPGLSDHLSYVVLAPYIGPRAAIEEIERGPGAAAVGA
jgi:AcrR family transcriptional regulator